MIQFLQTGNMSPPITRTLSAGFCRPPHLHPHPERERWVPRAEQSTCSVDRHLINTHETEQTASSPLAQAGLLSVGTDLSQPRFCSLTPAPCGVRNPKLTQHFQDVSFHLCPASRTKPLPLPFGAWIRSLVSSFLPSLYSRDTMSVLPACRI